MEVLEEALNLLSYDVKTILQSAESNLNALNTVDFRPKRPFSVGDVVNARCGRGCPGHAMLRKSQLRFV